MINPQQQRLPSGDDEELNHGGCKRKSDHKYSSCPRNLRSTAKTALLCPQGLRFVLGLTNSLEVSTDVNSKRTYLNHQDLAYTLVLRASLHTFRMENTPGHAPNITKHWRLRATLLRNTSHWCAFKCQAAHCIALGKSVYDNTFATSNTSEFLAAGLDATENGLV